MEKKVRYCYWKEGMKKPPYLPPNCEYQLSPVRDNWKSETYPPLTWSGDHKRRWPSRMDAFDDLFIRTCKNPNIHTVYRFRRIFAKRCALETKYAGMYAITVYLWELIQEYSLAKDIVRTAQQFMRPLYRDINDINTYDSLCDKRDYPDFGAGKDQLLASFVIATNIIRDAEAKLFDDLSTPAWFRNKQKECFK